MPVKLRFSENATKFWQNIQLDFTFSYQTYTKSPGRFRQFLWPSQKTWNLLHVRFAFHFLRMVTNYEMYLLKNNDLQQLKGKIEFVFF